MSSATSVILVIKMLFLALLMCQFLRFWLDVSRCFFPAGRPVIPRRIFCFSSINRQLSGIYPLEVSNRSIDGRFRRWALSLFQSCSKSRIESVCSQPYCLARDFEENQFLAQG